MSESMTSGTIFHHRRRGVADWTLRYGILLLLFILGSVWSRPAHAADFVTGDLVVGIGSSPDGSSQGMLRHFSPSGTLLDTLLTGSGSFEETGACFDTDKNLYTTNFEASSMSKFAPSGALSLASFGSELNSSPNSCVVNAAGHIYVGLADSPPDPDDPYHRPVYAGGGLVKLSAAGVVLGTFSPQPDGRGTDWIDLASDQCTLHYTSGGSSIKRFDVCMNSQLPDFCTTCDDGAGGVTGGTFFGLRLLPDGGLLVADWNYTGNSGLVRRYDSTGAQVNAYTATNAYGSQCGPDWAQPCFFPWALALDPDHSSVWVADNVSGEVFKFDLDTGAKLGSFQAGICTDAVSPCQITGLAIVGEPTAASPAPSPTPTTVTASITAADKVYDGTTVATITSCTLSGVLSGDTVTCSASNGAFNNASVGTSKPVSATVSLSGADAGKYVPASNSATTTASITPRPASVTPNAASKVYGAADPTFTGTLNGFLAVDGVTATYGRTAGEAVTAIPYVISATLSTPVAGSLGNYAISYETATFTITPASASVTPDAASKTYGTADPALSGTLSGFLASDGVTAAYARTPGESVAGSPYSISATLGPAAVLANYTITYSTASFTIAKAAASVTPNAASKTYGNADQALSGALSGFLGSDGVTASYARTAGETVAGSPYTISATLSPAAALGNYTVTYNTASFAITPRAASVASNPATKTYGTADPALGGVLAGFLPGDNVSAAYSRAPGENVAGSPYAISATLSPAAPLGNYTITYTTANFTITPATPILTWADPADIIYPTPLSGVQLNATANVPGSFAYTPPAGTVLNPGNGQPLSVFFTPTDNSNYTTATAQVHINVLQVSGPAEIADCPEDPNAVLTLAVDHTGAAHGSVPVYTTVQAAYDAAHNGDVIGMFSQTTENVVLGGAKSLTITQCTVAKITAQDNTQPVWNITSTGALTIIGPDSVGGSIGWRIGTSNHTVKSVRSTGAAQYGILVLGNNNSVSVNSVSASAVGIRVSGNSNDLRPGGTVSGNSGNGVEVGSTATGNTVRIGNIQTNGGNGIQIDGSSNTVTSNSRVDNNALNGILINGNSNTIKSNAAGSDKGKGNGQAGFKIVGGSNTLESNQANANGGVGLDLVGSGNKLKSNQSDQTSQGGNKENTGCEYRFADNTTLDQGGNKKDTASFTGSLSGPKYAAGCYE